MAAVAFCAALAFAASDIFFRVSAETVLFFAEADGFMDALFDDADFFAVADLFDGTAVFAAFFAVRAYLRLSGAASFGIPS